jgi:hypothetical protein
LSFTSIATGYIIKKTAAYQPLITGGMMFLTLGFALFIDLPEYTSWGRVILYQMIAGIGVGPNFQSPMMALQNSVAPHDIGAATSTFGFIRQLANAMSVVLGGVLLQNQLKGHRTEMIEAGIETRVVNLLTGGSAVSSVNEINRLPKFARQVARRAFAQSLSKMWIMYACIGIVGLGLTDFIRKRELSNEHKETVTGLEEQERIRKHEEELRTARKAGKGMGVLPDLEDQDSPKQDHIFSSPSGKSAEILGLSVPSRAPSRLSMRTPIVASSSNSPETPTNTSGYRDVEDAPQIAGQKREGAINAARRRSNLRQIGNSIAGGQHPVAPLRTNAGSESQDIQHQKAADGFYQDDFLEDTSSEDSDSVDIRLENARVEEEIRASQSYSSKTKSPIHSITESSKKGEGWGPLL